MDPIEVSKLDELLARAENLMDRVEDTYLITKDILLGTQISDWIEDLKTSGIESATYSDASRMNTLIANTDAANNDAIAKHLVSWAVSNNKYGIYCKGACGEVSGVTWESLTTPNAVMGDATAFMAVCENSVAAKATMENEPCKNAIWDKANITEACIRSSSSMKSALTSKSARTNVNGSASGKKWFLIQIEVSRENTASTPSYVTGSYGSVHVTGVTTTASVNRFVTGLSVLKEGSDDVRSDVWVRYVDFS